MNDTTKTWPSFASDTAALAYIRNNSGEFENGQTIAIVNFDDCVTLFFEARFTMEFIEIVD